MYIPPKVKEPDKSGIYYDYIPDVTYSVSDLSNLAQSLDENPSTSKPLVLDFQQEKRFWDCWLKDWESKGCPLQTSQQEVVTLQPKELYSERKAEPLLPRNVKSIKLPNDAFTYPAKETLGDHMPLDYKIYKYRATLGGIYLEVYNMRDLMFCAGVPWTIDLIAHLDLAVVRDWKRRKKEDRRGGR